jgi:hypothetical protein
MTIDKRIYSILKQTQDPVTFLLRHYYFHKHKTHITAVHYGGMFLLLLPSLLSWPLVDNMCAQINLLAKGNSIFPSNSSVIENLY